MQLRVPGLVIAALAVLGALLGLVWQAWSPAGPLGAVLRAGVQPDETEAWAAGDGRYALITAAVGLLAGFVAWYLTSSRGPWMAVALGVGGLAGAALTAVVGWAVRGSGPDFRCGSDTGRCVAHLPLTVHMHGLWFAEAVIGVLVYSLLAAFARDDDLGRPDPQRAAARAERSRGDDELTASSVGTQRGLEDGGRDSYRPGAPDKGDLPPQ